MALTSCNRGIHVVNELALFPDNQLYYIVDTIQIKNPVIVQRISDSDIPSDRKCFVFDIDSTQTPYRNLTSDDIKQYISDSIFYYSTYYLYPAVYTLAKDRINSYLKYEYTCYYDYEFQVTKIKDLELYGNTYGIYTPKIKSDGFVLCLWNVSSFICYGIVKEDKLNHYVPSQVTYIPVVYPYTKRELSTKEKEYIRKAYGRVNKEL